MQTFALRSLTTLALLAGASVALAQLELDIEVGRNDAGQLAFPAFDFGKILLDPVDPGNPFGLHGWSGDNPGWAAEGPPDGLLELEPGADVFVEVLSLSPALRMLDPDAGLADVPAGGVWHLGGPAFDAHPIWLIDSDSPSFNPNQQNWLGTFRLVDHGTTNYSPSAVHELRFGRVPEPNTLAMSAVALSFIVRRRR